MKKRGILKNRKTRENSFLYDVEETKGNGGSFLRALKYFFALVWIKILEWQYAPHVRVRLLHDKKYQKGGWYKQWTDKDYSAAVHKATLVSFILSFAVFSLAQSLFPYLFNAARPQQVLAGENNNTWTTRGDFNNGTTKSSVLISGSVDGDDANVTISSETAKFKDVAKVSVGGDHTLAVKTDGTLWAWGYNNSSQLGDGTAVSKPYPIQIGTATNWQSISAGNAHSLAIKTDGTLWAWGNNGQGRLGHGDQVVRNVPTKVGTATNWQSVSAGGVYSMGVRTDGTLWGWGYNGTYQIGDGTTNSRFAPVQIGTDTNWQKVEASKNTTGYSHTIATKTNGTLWGWGENGSYQLGLTDTTDRATPTQIGSDANWQSVGVGDWHSMALKSNGTLWTWGYTPSGIGHGDTASKSTPTQLGSDTSWQAFSAGYDYALAKKSTGTLWVWGNNSYGKLGLGDTTQRTSPVQIGSGTDWSVMAGGYNHTGAIKTNNNLWVWGYNGQGHLGDNSTTYRTTPIQPYDTRLSAAINVGSIATGTGHTIVVKTDGTLWGWGYNEGGAVGDGTNVTPRPIPVQIGAATNWQSVSAGNANSLGIKTDGTLWAWGNNDYGQLGLGDYNLRNTPTQIGNATNWQSVSAGYNHTLAIKTDGTLWGWGYNHGSDLGLGETLNHIVPVQIGTDNNWQSVEAAGINFFDGEETWTDLGFSFGIKTNGTLWSWGANDVGQLGLGDQNPRTVPTQVGSDTNWQSVSGGQRSALALKTNGTLFGWGLNTSYQLGLGDQTTRTSPTQIGTDTNWQSVSAGTSHSTAVKTGGTLWTWGSGGNGRLGTGDTSTKTTPTQVGSDTNWQSNSTNSAHNMAKKADNTLYGFGYNVYGQLATEDTTERTSPVLINYFYFAIGYNSPGTISALKLNAGNVSKWASISWNGTTPANTAIKMRTRGAATEGGLSSADWSGFYEVSGSAITTASSLWLEVEVTLESSVISSTPTLTDVMITYDTVEAPENARMNLRKSDVTTQLKNTFGTSIGNGAAGGYTNESQLKLTTTSLSCASCASSTNRRIQVEAKALGVEFDGAGLFEGDSQTGGTASTALITGLAPASYHVRARTIDDEGRVSAWTSYGANAESAADFTVEQTTPTISAFSINSGVNYTSSIQLPLIFPALSLA